MIKGRLSVGDWINLASIGGGVIFSPHILMGQDIADITSGTIPQHRIFPIPLTAKVMVDRCGFNNSVSSADVVYKDSPDRKDFFNVVPNPLQRGSWLFCYNGIKAPISTLHELQQIYYAIFREELKITL